VDTHEGSPPGKAFFRERVARAFASLSPAARAERSARIAARIRALPEFAAARTVLFYFPLPDEVDVAPLMAAVLPSKKVCLPLCRPEDGTLVLKRVTDPARDTVAGAYGIREPRRACPPVPAEEADCILVPGRAFDRRGRRIGRGAGYYDRLLAETRAVTVAPCMSFQLFSRVPAASHDVPVAIIVTEEEVIRP